MLKQNPYYTYQIDAIESWLDEQAKKGFLLNNRFGTLFSFEKGEPAQLRYRIDVKRRIGYEDEEERITAYRDMGWEYVCSLSSHADIYVSRDPNATELNTDEGTLHEVLDTLLKREIYFLIAAVVIILLLWGNTLLLQGWEGYHGVYDRMLNGLSVFFIPMGVLIILTWVIPMALHLYDAVQTRRRLLLTREYHTAAQAMKRQTLNRCVLATALLVLLTLGVLWGYTKSGGDIPAEDFPGPTVTALFPGHAPASFRPYSNNTPDEMIWTGNLPLIHSARIRQYGYEQLSPNDEFDRQLLWIYNADVETVCSESLAEKYAAEEAEYFGMEPVSIAGWANGWFIKDNGITEQDVFRQEVLLQDGKEVWSFAYLSYGEAPQYDLVSAVKAYLQANRAG